MKHERTHEEWEALCGEAIIARVSFVHCDSEEPSEPTYLIGGSRTVYDSNGEALDQEEHPEAYEMCELNNTRPVPLDQHAAIGQWIEDISDGRFRYDPSIPERLDKQYENESLEERKARLMAKFEDGTKD